MQGWPLCQPPSPVFRFNGVLSVVACLQDELTFAATSDGFGPDRTNQMGPALTGLGFCSDLKIPY